MKLKEAINMLKLNDNDIIFIHQYLKSGDKSIAISKLDNKIKNKELIKIQAHFGGIEHGYNCYRFIYK